MSDQAASHYTLLGIPPLAEAPAIRAAFRQRIREVHPDVNQAPGAAELTVRLTEAFRVLSNPAARTAYDSELRRRRMLELSRGDMLAPAEPPTVPATRSARPSWGRLAGGYAVALLIVCGLSAATWQVAVLWGGDGPDATSTELRASATRLPIAVAVQTLTPPFRREAALAVPPVQADAVRLAAARFQRVAWGRGMVGAAAFSGRCHALAQRLNSWASADFCAAFDHAGYLVEGGADDAASRAAAGYFIDRHTDQARFYAGFGVEPMLVDAHLDRLRASIPSAAARSALQPPAPR